MFRDLIGFKSNIWPLPDYCYKMLYELARCNSMKCTAMNATIYELEPYRIDDIHEHCVQVSFMKHQSTVALSDFMIPCVQVDNDATDPYQSYFDFYAKDIEEYMKLCCSAILYEYDPCFNKYTRNGISFSVPYEELMLIKDLYAVN